MNRLSTADRLAHSYLDAKCAVIEAGFAGEIDWQEEVVFKDLSEETFLKEYTWVVFSSGFREAVLARLYPKLVVAFAGLRSAAVIDEQRAICRERALKIFAHSGKVAAVLEVARIIRGQGFPAFKRRIYEEKVDYLDTLPFLGPATSLHLAKNIGLDVVKPDRHLVRIARSSGFDTPTDLCASIRDVVGDTLSVVDLVIWRYATLHPGKSLPGFTPHFRCVRGII